MLQVGNPDPGKMDSSTQRDSFHSSFENDDATINEGVDMTDSPFTHKETVFKDASGSATEQPVVFFDEEAYKKGFNRAWAIVIKPGDTREKVHAAIVAALEKVKDDKELKNSLISTYCDIAREDNRVFYNEDSLKRSIGRVTDALNASNRFKEETSKAGKLSRQSLVADDEPTTFIGGDGNE